MTHKSYIITPLLGLLLSLPGLAQEERSLARKGNQDYHQEAYSEAEVKYRKSLKKASDFNKARFNLGNNRSVISGPLKSTSRSLRTLTMSR